MERARTSHSVRPSEKQESPGFSHGERQVPYYVHPEVWPEDQPSEHDEMIDTTARAKKHGRWLRWIVITIICAWFGMFSLGVLTGNSIGSSIGVATVFCVGIGCCLAVGYEE